MSRIYGISCLLNSFVVLSFFGFQSYIIILNIIDGKFKIGNLVFFAIVVAFLVPTIKFLIESIHAIKGNLSISPKEKDFKKLIFYFGIGMIGASAIVHIVTILLIIITAVSGSTGGPVGMGFGFGLLLFSGYILLKFTMQKHSQSLKYGTAQSAAP